jgi:hypothetical protein
LGSHLFFVFKFTIFSLKMINLMSEYYCVYHLSLYVGKEHSKGIKSHKTSKTAVTGFLRSLF